MRVVVEDRRVAEMVCIVCPVGCRLRAEVVEGQVKVAGNTCARGIKYASEELTNPTRTVTSSVNVTGGQVSLLSVKTAKPVPKASIPAVLAAIRCASAHAPVRMGDVVVNDVANTGVDVVATRSVREKEMGSSQEPRLGSVQSLIGL